MDGLPAKTGLAWIKEGVLLFIRQPGQLFTLFTAYFLFTLLLQLIPVIGGILTFVLVPVTAMVFMHACVHVEQEKQVHPNLLLTAFQSPALPSLLKLGALYPIATILAVASSMVIDGGMLLSLMSGKMALNAKEAHDPKVMLAMLFAFVVYLPAGMAFWYAAPLISWKKMGLGKALFYSFFAVLRNLKAFAAYIGMWIVIYFAMTALASLLIAPMLGIRAAAVVLLMMMPVVMVLMYCSFYPTFTDLFGRPDPETAP